MSNQPQNGKKMYLYQVVKGALNMSLEQFCETHLKCEYRSFLYRLKSGNIHIKDFIKISELCNVSLDDIAKNEPNFAKYYTSMPIPDQTPVTKPAPEPVEQTEPVAESGFAFIDT